MSESYVDIMLQSLRKKEDVLDQIIRLDDEQQHALDRTDLTPEEFDKIVEEKSKLIDQLEKLDDGFEKLFARMKGELEGNKEQYADQIRQMQQHIKNITDKSVQIQVQEARNKELMMRKFTAIKEQARSVRTSGKVASQYYKNMTKLNYVDPQFMDNKN